MQLLVAAAAVNVGADSSRVARDEWGRELASGRWFCLCHSIQFVLLHALASGTELFKCYVEYIK